MAKEDLDELEQVEDQDGDDEESESGEGGGSGKKKLIFILLALLLLGGGGAYWFLMKPHDEEKVERKPPTYVRLDPMVVNVSDEAESHFLQVTIDLKVEDAKVAAELELLMPEIRDGILLLLAGQNPYEVVTPQKREQLRKEVLKISNKALAEFQHKTKDPHPPIKGAYFTTFVLQ